MLITRIKQDLELLKGMSRPLTPKAQSGGHLQKSKPGLIYDLDSAVLFGQDKSPYYT